MWSLSAGVALQSAGREGLFTLLSVPIAAAAELSLNTFFWGKGLFIFFELVPFLTWSNTAFGAIVGISEAVGCSLELFSLEGCAE